MVSWQVRRRKRRRLTDVRYRAFATDVLPFSIGWMLHLGVLRSSIRQGEQRNRQGTMRATYVLRDYGTPWPLSYGLPLSRCPPARNLACRLRVLLCTTVHNQMLLTLVLASYHGIYARQTEGGAVIFTSSGCARTVTSFRRQRASRGTTALRFLL